MSRLLTGNKLQSTYENFVAECPHCHEPCTFNRASDLKAYEPISGMDVHCFNPACAKPFRITCDLINPRHEMLVFDCENFLKEKRYMHCILSLCHAYEVFFSEFLRVELLYKPFWKDQDCEDLDQVAQLLWNVTEKWPFARLRAVFLRRVVDQIPPPANLTKTLSVIEGLSKPQKQEIPESDIDKLGDPELVLILKKLNASTIHKKRNNVIHKDAYRPSKDEAEAALAETKSILMPLTFILDIQENINWYQSDANTEDT